MAVRICVSSSLTVLRPVVVSSNKYISNNIAFKQSSFNERCFIAHKACYSSQGTVVKQTESSLEQWIIPSKYSDVDIPDVSLPEYLLDSQEKYAKLTAFVEGISGRSLTFREQQERSIRVGSALSRRGISKGDVVAIVAPNCIEYVVSFFAIVNTGATVTTVNPASTAGEIRVQLVNSNTCAVICHEDELQKILDSCKGLENIRYIVVAGGKEEHKGTLSLEELLKDDGKGLPCNLNINPSEDTIILPYSSGTTGLPKGVVLTHRNLVSNIQQINHPDVQQIPCSTDDKQEIGIIVLPLYHIYALSLLINAIYIGAKNVLMKKFEQKTFIAALEKYPFTILHTVPPLLGFLESSSLINRHHLRSCRITFCGAAPIGPTLLQQFLEKFPGVDFIEGYGMTEASPLTHVSERGNFVAGSCGPSVPNTSIKIVDLDTGKTLGPNEGTGELCVRGPQVMKGYLNNEEANRKTLIDGWLYTGDIAKMDEKFNVYIVDRLKELIKVKGLQVAPAELEDLLRLHPSVEDVAVIGVPDERAGELPKAFIVLAEGFKEDPEEIKEFVAERVSSYKQLSAGVEFIKEIPKSAAGKILRKNLKENIV